ncbi:MAG: glycosyltransferase [Planctomycetota bacterium]
MVAEKADGAALFPEGEGRPLRTALVHDWLTGMRGGEKVLEVLCDLLPQSDLYTLMHVPGRVSALIERRRVAASWLSRLPGVRHYYRYLLPLMPWTAARMQLSGYDLVLAVSHCVAHGVSVEPGVPLVCYCNTPMRYAWGMFDTYFPKTRRMDPRYWLLRGCAPLLRAWDRRASQRVTAYVANSRNVQERIRKCYGRESTVVYPPVETDYYRPVGGPAGEFYLWIGALVPYKRIDLALDAFRLLDRPLVVIGDGQCLKWARRRAPSNVKVLGWQPDDVVRRHLSACRALIAPGEEDFGITALEAQACGRPVIAFGAGGALETVRDPAGEGAGGAPTGVLFHEQTPGALAAAVRRFEELEAHFRPEDLRSHALHFSRRRCRAELAAYLSKVMRGVAAC